MVETVFLHIGHPKTGSTSIEKFCVANTNVLHELGYLYPKSGLINMGHHGLASNWYRRHNYPDKSSSKIAKLVNELSCSMCNCAIVTSDILVHIDPESLKSLRERFRVQCVYYVRRQDDYVESVYNEIVKNPYNREIGDIQEIYRRLIPSYIKIIRKYERVFGTGNVIVRVFDRTRHQEFDLIHDFINVVGLEDHVSKLMFPSEMNPRLGYEYLLFKRQYNALPLETEEMTAIALEISELSSKKLHVPYRCLDIETRAAIMEKCREENEVLAREYLHCTPNELFGEMPTNESAKVVRIKNISREQEEKILEELSERSREIIADAKAYMGLYALPAIPGDPHGVDLLKKKSAELITARRLDKMHSQLLHFESRLRNLEHGDSFSGLSGYWKRLKQKRSYFRFRRALRRTKAKKYFSPAYYLENYPDVKLSGMDPCRHYFIYGWRENRNPSEYFSTAFYLRQYPDVAKSGMNPLMHYVLFGMREGRQAMAIEQNKG